MKEVVIVTGASSGLGRDFALSVPHNIVLDEMWVVARPNENLASIQKDIPVPVKVLEMDLTEDKNIEKIKNLLEEEKPIVKLLVNASGYGKFEKTTNISYEDNIGMIKLNIEALTKLCLIVLPYMKKGSSIVNFGSVASFQPVPYVNIYAATKAYVLSFSRALNQELKKDGIHVMTVCPFWTKTKFFDRAVSENKVVKKYVAMYESIDNVNKAWKDLKKKKDVSQYGFIARSQVVLSKIIPHRIIMKIWLKQQDLNK